MPDENELFEIHNERLVAEDVSQAVWLRLRRLTSSRLCKRILTSRIKDLLPDVLEKKAEGLAWAVRSALGYWESNPAALNSKILTRYYAMLQITVAEQVASQDPTADLKEIQRHTEYGHGLSTLNAPSCLFPANYLLACLKSGHFSTYCKYRGIDLNAYAFEKRPKEWSSLTLEEKGRLVSLADFFRRVPELQPMIEECLEIEPLSFHVGHASRNMEIRSRRSEEYMERTGQLILNAPSNGSSETTYIAIYPNGQRITKEFLNSLSLPIKNIEFERDSVTESTYFVGEFSHPSGDYWWQHLNTYKSGYCGTSIIVPFWGTIDDPFLIHFIILYALSIVVRYLPSLWHDIEDGDLDHIRALIEYYLVVVDNVLPKMAVERITGVRLHVDQPGSLNAPI